MNRMENTPNEKRNLRKEEVKEEVCEREARCAFAILGGREPKQKEERSEYAWANTPFFRGERGLTIRRLRWTVLAALEREIACAHIEDRPNPFTLPEPKKEKNAPWSTAASLVEEAGNIARRVIRRASMPPHGYRFTRTCRIFRRRNFVRNEWEGTGSIRFNGATLKWRKRKRIQNAAANRSTAPGNGAVRFLQHHSAIGTSASPGSVDEKDRLRV